MVKRDLVNLISQKAHMPKRAARESLEVFIQEIGKALARREKVLISGFGTFKARKVKDKPVTIPHTGEKRIIRSHWMPRFIPGKPLKKAIR